MKIKFLKEYRAIGDFGMPGKAIIVRSIIGDTADNLDDEDAQWLIDNGFAEEVQESGWWKPKRNDKYYFLGSIGEVGAIPWYNDKLDEYRYSVGNTFKTKEAAERYRDYRKAVVTIRQDKGVLTPEQVYMRAEGDGEAYHVGYMGKQGGEDVLDVCEIDLYFWPPAGAILFDTSEHAEASLDNHLDEWKIIVSYDWSRE